MADFAHMIEEDYEGAVALAEGAIAALRLHVAFEAVRADRGGKSGPKGRAWAAFIDARDAALAMAEGSAP